MQQVEQQQGTDQTNANLQVLFHALSSCAIVPVQQLITGNPDLLKCKGWNGQTALHRACLTGDKNIIKYLLDAGADPNLVNNFNETSVHYASKRGIPGIVHLLVKHGGKLDVRDGHGRTPVHDAAQLGSVYLLKYFEEKGFNFKDLDYNLQSPLHIACGFGQLEAFKFLMRKGRSDPTQQDKDGNTPLHICAKEGYAHGSWLLVNYIGLSSLYVQNKEGYTPHDIAKQYESSTKDGYKKLLALFNELSTLPQNSQIKGPWAMWYRNLFGPVLIYLVALIPALFMVPSYQGLVMFAAVGYIIRLTRGASHRLDHISRWPSPWYIGLFSAGIFHTMLVYYCHISFYIKDHQGLYIFSILANIYLLYQYWKLFRADAGVVTSTMIDEKTNKPLTVLDLCEEGTGLDNYCGECEIVRTRDTKHCRICEKCYYRMDHHCLFLIKCIAHNNHVRFVWFLILVAITMAVFVFEAIYYINTVYPSMTLIAKIKTMFWTDCWVLSMVILNICSVGWALFLVRYQLIVISKAQTSYFQQRITTLTPIEQFMNVLTFLQGKPFYATDFKFEPSDVCQQQNKGQIYPVQPGSYPKQQWNQGHSHQQSIQTV